jgi:hypothetical protein
MRLTLALVCFATPALAEMEPLDYLTEIPAVDTIIAAARASCLAETDNDQILHTPELAITYTDLDGDNGLNDFAEFDDAVIDFNYMTCAGGNIWAGTGGAPVHFVLDGETSASWTGFGWDVVRFSAYTPALILLGRHGSYCDGYGAQPCVQAIVVDEGKFSYVTEPRPNELQ